MRCLVHDVYVLTLLNELLSTIIVYFFKWWNWTLDRLQHLENNTQFFYDCTKCTCLDCTQKTCSTKVNNKSVRWQIGFGWFSRWAKYFENAVLFSFICIQGLIFIVYIYEYSLHIFHLWFWLLGCNLSYDLFGAVLATIWAFNRWSSNVSVCIWIRHALQTKH